MWPGVTTPGASSIVWYQPGLASTALLISVAFTGGKLVGGAVSAPDPERAGMVVALVAGDQRPQTVGALPGQGLDGDQDLPTGVAGQERLQQVLLVPVP